jgi:hypothetical protein
MIALREEYVYTIHPEGKDGVKIKAEWYHSIKAYMIEILKNENEISLNSFVEMVHSQFVDELGENAGWFVYHVKLDMEARGMLKHTRLNKGRERQGKIMMLPSMLKRAVADTVPNRSRPKQLFKYL